MVFLIDQEHSCRRLITHASKHTWEFLGSREKCGKRKGNECLRCIEVFGKRWYTFEKQVIDFFNDRRNENYGKM